ncbi:FtsH protease activity modulator HflK [Rhodovibrionaceae bacterium A322]
MPWQSSGGSGGPWGGGDKNSGSGGGGPWGQGGGSGGGGQRPPDIEEAIRKGQERLKSAMPGGFGSGKGLFLVLVILLGLWGATGFYRVQADQQGVILRFGQWVNEGNPALPGLHWHLPYPIETVYTPSVERLNALDIGMRTTGGTRSRDIPEESLMLTGDQNIIDIDFTVIWKIRDAGRYLFNIRNPEGTVKITAESAMREIIGQTDIQRALTESRQTIEIETRDLLQKVLDEYEAGIEITQVQLQQVQPPAPVKASFDDVQAALQDRDRARNLAEAYRNDILPRARGNAQRVIQEAEGYKEQKLNEAQGEAQRFLKVYEAYRSSPDLTRERMYLETMEQVLQRTDKVIMGDQGQGVVPYLPLNELKSKSSN